MNINDVYQSNYLKAEDLRGRRVDVVISEAKVEDIGGSEKLVLSFEGKEKRLVCNVTNARMIAGLLDTPETKEWIGREITLRPDKTTFQGSLMDCLRVDGVLPGQPEAADDTEIPF